MTLGRKMSESSSTPQAKANARHRAGVRTQLREIQLGIAEVKPQVAQATAQLLDRLAEQPRKHGESK
jgi:hypothetical protein